MTRHENEPILVFVPAEHPDAVFVERGAGIVGWGIDGTDDVAVWFEGNRHGYASIRNYADRCALAVDRATQNAPTTAKRILVRDAVAVVGVWNAADGCVEPTDLGRRLIAGWVNVADEDLAGELRRSDRPAPT